MAWFYVLNNSGFVIEVLHASPVGDRSERPRTFQLGPFRAPRLIVKSGRDELMEAGGANVVEFKFGKCRAWYEIPPLGDYNDIAVQVEPNAVLYVAPDDALGPVERRDLPAQPAGFPLLAEEMRCSE